MYKTTTFVMLISFSKSNSRILLTLLVIVFLIKFNSQKFDNILLPNSLVLTKPFVSFSFCKNHIS